MRRTRSERRYFKQKAIRKYRKIADIRWNWTEPSDERKHKMVFRLMEHPPYLARRKKWTRLKRKKMDRIMMNEIKKELKENVT